MTEDKLSLRFTADWNSPKGRDPTRVLNRSDSTGSMKRPPRMHEEEGGLLVSFFCLSRVFLARVVRVNKKGDVSAGVPFAKLTVQFT